MEIYLAASWSQRKRMRDIAERLAALNIGVTSQWIRSGQPVGMGPKEIADDRARAMQGALRDLEGINAADRMAVFTDVPSSTGGFHVEYGYALSRGMPIDVIGPRPNVFYSLQFPGVRHFASTVSWFVQLQNDKENDGGSKTGRA